MKKIILGMAVLVVAGAVEAQNVPSGVAGLWRFQTSADKLKATVGTDLTTTGSATWYSGPWTIIEPGMSDGGVVQEESWNYLTVTHGIAPNGGGSYVNKYTVAMDYIQTSDAGLWNGDYYNSLFQTSQVNGNDGDLFIKGPSRSASVIGTGDTGYSTLTFDAGSWHRIVWSVDNGNFFKVFIDGTLYLNGTAQAVDGRFSLDPTFLLCADNDWEDAWGLIGTVAVWNRALTDTEVAGMGGWLNGSATPTPLYLVPEPGTLSLLALGGLALLLRKRQ